MTSINYGNGIRFRLHILLIKFVCIIQINSHKVLQDYFGLISNNKIRIRMNYESVNLNHNHSHNYIEEYKLLLTQFNKFKQESVLQKEKFYQEIEKHRQTKDAYVKKLEKKYQNSLHEERAKFVKLKEKYQKSAVQQTQSFQEQINLKKQIISELSEYIVQLQRQKRQIIEQNTKSLLQLARSQQKHMSQGQYSSQQILKMYQYLLQENQTLKKQLNMISYHQVPVASFQPSSKKNESTKKSKEIVYMFTQSSNKKNMSPNNESMNFSKNYSFVNMKDSKEDCNLNRVKSNTSQHSSKMKKQVIVTNPNINQSISQNQATKFPNSKKKAKPMIPIGTMQKKKPT